MESVHVVFDVKKIQGLVDEGNHDTLQFKNEHIRDVIESDEEECSNGNYVSVDIFHQWIIHIHRWITYQLIDIHQLIIHQLINLL